MVPPDNSGVQTNSGLQTQEILQLLEEGSLEGRVIIERNEEVKQIESDIRDLGVIFQTVQEMIQEQEEDLDIAERSVTVAAHETEKGVGNLQNALKIKKKTRHLKLFAGSGALGGAAIGTVGFLINPPIGIVLAIAGIGLGLGTGAFLGYTTKS